VSFDHALSAVDDTEGGGRQPATRPQRRRRLWLWPTLIVLLLIAAAGWLAFRAVQIDHNLRAARAALSGIEAQLRDGKPLPTALMKDAQQHTRTARDAARDPIWTIAARIPWVGRPLHTAGGIAEIGDRIAHDSLPRLSAVSDSLQTIRESDATHHLPLDTMREVAVDLGVVDTQLSDDLYALQRLPGSAISPLATARSLLLTQLHRADDSVHTAAVATKLAVPMLGSNGPRRYFVAFENPAEARPDIGLLAGYAEVTADDGRLHREVVDASSGLPKPVFPGGVVMPQGYEAFGAGHRWSNTNLSPDFSEDAEFWTAMYGASTRRLIDGAFALDPVAMGAILQEAGRNLTVPGIGTVKAADVATFLESTEYTLDLKETVRKQLLAAAGRQTVDALLASHTSTIGLARALAHLAGTGHLHIYSAHPDEQAQIDDFPIAGTFPSTDRPFAGAYVTNSAANKLDYYLDEQVTWQTTSCADNATQGTVTVTLTNTVPDHGVPTFVLRNHVRRSVRLPDGTHKVLLSLVLAPGSTIRDAKLAGEPVDWALVSKERGERPLYMVTVVLPPHSPRTLTVNVEQPHTGAPVLGTQPLPRRPVIQVDGRTC
jgi:hypothetical protein